MFLSNLDRRVLATLSESALRRLKPGLRIAVLGNCHSLGVAYAMNLLNVSATIDRFPIQAKTKITGDMLVRALRTYDHVFLQDFGPGLVRRGSSDLLRDKLTSVTRYPALLFAGYHPDSIFISDPSRNGGFLSGPIGQHHSALALFSYRAGLAPEASLRLFNRAVFEALGYFDIWDAASAQLFEVADSYSIDLRADFIRWTRRNSCFMYAINHPKPHVFFDLARHLLDKAGIASNPIDFDHYARDDLARDTVYPVYPEIAERFDIAGSYIFKAPENSGRGLKLGKAWDLPGFVRECHRVYATHNPKQLTNERVQGWLDNPEISAFLKGNGSDKRNAAPGPEEQHATSAEPAGIGS